MRAAQPELVEFPTYLRQHYAALAEGGTPTLIRVVRSATLAAVVPWLEDKVVCQTVHAYPGDPERGGKGEWFDSVEVQADDGAWYAQLRLIFTDGKDSVTGNQLALVRWYEELQPNNNDVLVRHGCKALKWEQIQGRPRYYVIPMSTILRRLYVVPNFANVGEGQFHVSVFKWDRGVADKQEYEG